MSLRVRGDERFIRNMPVVGIQPTLYGFNNLGSILTPPYVNEIQMYNPITGTMGPSFKPSSILDNIRTGFQNNPNFNVIQSQVPAQVRSTIYSNNNLYIGLVGTDADIMIVKKILDDHLSKNTSTTTILGSTPAPVPAPAPVPLGGPLPAK
jgi:hypothetical protein